MAEHSYGPLQPPLKCTVKKNLPKWSENSYGRGRVIIFLDTATVDLGDVDLTPLKKAGRFLSYGDTKASQIVGRSRGASVVITNKCVLGAREMEALPRLKLICVAATGVNNIDLDAARLRGIAVANVPGYSTATVAEHAVLFLLALSHRLLEHHESARSRWSRSGRFALLDHPYGDLQGKTLGIFGYGHIGRRVARLAGALGMKVKIARLPGRRYARIPRRHSVQDVLRTSDFVTLHCPLNRATHHLINKESLKRMKPGAYLLNLARGGLVNERDLAASLRRGRPAGYATDVLEREPPPSGYPLLRKGLAEKVLVTPHVAWASRESRQRLVGEIARNIRAFQNGLRRNRVV
jgi:glycerate dehydrogenase